MKYFYTTIIIISFSKFIYADSNIIKNGHIIKSKSYSFNETTLIVNNSDKIYICSIVDKLTKCILSSNKNKIN